MAKDSGAGRGGWDKPQHLFDPKAFLFLTLFFATACGVFGQPQEITLSTGQKQSFSVEPGQELHFHVPLPSGRHLWFEVRGWNLDSVIEVSDHQGKKLFTAQSPLARFGNDGALLKSNQEGFYKVKVRARKGQIIPGEVEIQVQLLPQETHAQQKQLAALELISQGDGLFFKGDPESLEKALSNYDQAAKIWHSLNRMDRHSEALYRKAEVFLDLGDYQNANCWFQEVSELAAEGSSAYWRAAVISSLAWTYTQLNKMEIALPLYMEVLDYWSSQGIWHGEAGVLENLGINFGKAGKLESSEYYLLLAKDIYKVAGDRTDIGNNYGNLSMIYFLLCDLDKSELYFNEALDHGRAINGSFLPSLYNNRAIFFRSSGEPQKALEYYEKAMAIARKSKNPVELARHLNNMSFLYFSMGDYQRVISSSKESLHLSMSFGSASDVASAHRRLGQAYGILGDLKQTKLHYDMAIDYYGSTGNQYDDRRKHQIQASWLVLNGAYRDALEQYLKALELTSPKRTNLFAWYNTLPGLVYNLLDKPEKALDRLRIALEYHQKSGNVLGKTQTLFGLAKAQAALDDEEKALDNALAAIELIESVRERSGDFSLRTSFFATNYDVYAFCVELYMQLHQRNPGHGYHLKALKMSEKARARVLLDLLMEAEADITRDLPRHLLKSHQEEMRKLNITASLRSGFRNADHPRTKELAIQIREINQRLENIKAEMRQASPRFKSLTWETVDLETIQQNMAEDALVLEYFLGDKRSYLWAISATGVTSYVLDDRKTIESAAREVHGQLGGYPGTKGQRRPSQKLADLILDPVKADLKNRKLIIVPDGALHYVPFSALRLRLGKGPGANELGTLHFLLELCEITTLPSLAVMDRLSSSDSSKVRKVVVFADPVYEFEGSGSLNQRQPELQPLPFSHDEAIAIRNIAGKANTTLFLAHDANKETLLNNRLDSYDIVHFATHAKLDQQHPKLSALYLSYFDEHGGPVDELLHINAIAELKLDADLVVLSACETALGKEVKGEGLVGFTRAFFYAGARQIMATLWVIEDQASADLMKLFYQYMLHEGLAPSAALRKAQLDFLNSDRRDPNFWAGFFVQGESGLAFGK